MKSVTLAIIAIISTVNCITYQYPFTASETNSNGEAIVHIDMNRLLEDVQYEPDEWPTLVKGIISVEGNINEINIGDIYVIEGVDTIYHTTQMSTNADNTQFAFNNLFNNSNSGTSFSEENNFHDVALKLIITTSNLNKHSVDLTGNWKLHITREFCYFRLG